MDKHQLLSHAATGLKEPLHSKVRQSLRRLILSNFEDGQRFYSERELLSKLKVSQPTVRRALGDLADEGFLVVSARRGFFVRKHTAVPSVGVCIPSYEDTFAPKHLALDGISAVCRAHEYPLHVYYTHKKDTTAEILARMRSTPVQERIILCEPVLPQLIQLHDALEKEGYWSVAMFGQPDSGYTGSFVSVNHELEIRLMLDHLVGLGHRRIAFVANEPAKMGDVDARIRLIKQMVAERRLTESRFVSSETELWTSSFNAAYRSMDALFVEKPWPTAVVPLSGVGSWAALRYLLRRGIKVPEQVSVFSLDDEPGSDMLPVALTATRISVEQKAEAAFALLWDDRTVGVRHIEPEFIQRESTGPCLER